MSDNIVSWCRDGKLFGALPRFRDLSTWRPWLVFLRAVYGLPLSRAELEIFRRHTGRDAPREGGYLEAVVVVGRQSGKTQIAALVGAYEAASAVLRGERNVFVPLVAQDARAAQRALLGYVREAFTAIPMLAKMVSRELVSGIELAGGVSLAIYPCRPAALRGIRSAASIVDELAFFISSEGRPTDVEMLRAIRPSLATTSGRLLVLSSPYGQAGALWDLHRRHCGRDTGVLLWQAGAPDMNPTLAADYLARMREEDPEAYRSEVLGEFRAGVAQLFDPEALEAVVAPEVRERAPQPGPAYRAFVDPSGGRRDAFALAVAHASPDGVAVLDVVRAWAPPFNPSGVVAEAAALLREYRVHRCSGDRYSAEFVAEHFRAHGVQYEGSELDRSEIYLEMLHLVNARGCLLLDSPDLLRELRGLERRRGASGKDRIDHRRDGHDDRANASAGALVLAAGRRRAMTAGELAEHVGLMEEASEGARGEAERAFALRNGGGFGDPLNSGFTGYGPGGWPSRFDGDL